MPITSSFSRGQAGFDDNTRLIWPIATPSTGCRRLLLLQSSPRCCEIRPLDVVHLGKLGSSEPRASMIAAATTRRVNHLWSAGTTYQGAWLAAVARIYSHTLPRIRSNSHAPSCRPWRTSSSYRGCPISVRTVFLFLFGKVQKELAEDNAVSRKISLNATNILVTIFPNGLGD